MSMKKYQAIIYYLRTVDTATTAEIYNNVKELNYYANAFKHTGNILSTMVKKKWIERVKPGVFRLKPILKQGMQKTLFW